MGFLPNFYTVLVASVPLPFPFLSALRQIEVETSTETAGIFRLHFELSQTVFGDWDVLQFDIFRPLVPIQIRISLGNGLSEPLINGYIREARLNNRTEPGRSTLDVIGMDATATLMTLQEKCMPWPNMPDSAIVAAIFGQYGIVPNVRPTASARVMVETTTIQRATDINYMRDIAERNSYECYVQPDPVIGLDNGYFGPPQLLMPWQGVLSVNFGAATNLDNFDVSYDSLQPTSALAKALDDSTKAPLSGTGLAATELPMGSEPTLLRILPPPIVRPAGTQAVNAGELMAMASSIANRSSRAIRARGEVDGLNYGRALRPGLPVLVRGAGRQHSGLYYVTHVAHTISNERYTQRFEAWRNAVGMTGAEVFIDPMAALT